MDVAFADDVTQVITQEGQNINNLLNRAKREIVRMNDFEKKWKIKTNKNKFQLLQVSAIKQEPIIIDGEQLQYANKVNTLGFNLQRTGFTQHINQRKAIASAAVAKLKRFRNLKPKIKAHLYKSLVRSRLEYPSALIAIMSKTNMKKYQSFQNRIIRNFIATPNEKYDDIGDLHARYKIEALNTRMQRRLKQTWSKFEELEPEMANVTTQYNDDDLRDHAWWKRIGAYVYQQDEDPNYG